MTWWAWVIGGVILLGAELGFIDAQFYLVFIGISAVLVGTVSFALPASPAWLHWALFGVLAIVSVSTFRRAIYERLKRDLPHAVQKGPAGESVTLPASLAPGESCQVEFRGSHWTVTNGSARTLAAASVAKITRISGLTLFVQADE